MSGSGAGSPRVAVVALGANVGDPEAAIRRAVQALARLGRVVAASRIYLTEPVGGPPGQPPYRNAVVVMEPRPPWGTPERLMAALLALEVGAGRVRRERWGPRSLDLDLISFGHEERQSEALTLPHPRAAERAFVMVPLAEAWPTWRGPDGRDATAIAAALDHTGVVPTAARPCP